jgi:8-oxo-dGTP pyrophosphatase MutT (NUDIX family)
VTYIPEVAVRPAATVVLLRDGADGLEVWLQQRASTLAFAAGMHAFPGGAVDPEDAGVAMPGVDSGFHAQVWGDADPGVARTHIATAIRETTEESGVVLDPTSLVPWSRWVTPPGEVRRFDARFYVAACPPDQSPRPLTGEVAAGEWFVVRAAVEAFATGALPMWEPTITTLLELVPFDEVAAALAAAPQRIEAVTE